MRGVLLWGAFALWMLSGFLPVPSGETSAADLRLSPALVTARSGETVRLEVWVEGAGNLNRVEFTATYPAEVLEPVDGDLERDGVQMEVGPVFSGGCIPENRAEGGTLRWVAWRAPEAGPFSGDGVVAVVTFRVREGAPPGVYPIVFDPGSVRLLDPEGRPLAVGSVEDGAVRVPPVTTGLRGWITREGTTSYGGTAVTVLFYPSGDSYPTTWARACTDEGGNFYLAVPETEEPLPSGFPLPAGGPPAGAYEWAYIRLDFPNYGSECYWEPLDEEVVDIGWHILEGGDVNGDGCINIFDIVRIIADFGESVAAPCFVPFAPCPSGEVGAVAPASDVNGDCRVNIFDLTMAAENFGLCTNCP
jgi:hypothetical protein